MGRTRCGGTRPQSSARRQSREGAAMNRARGPAVKRKAPQVGHSAAIIRSRGRTCENRCSPRRVGRRLAGALFAPRHRRRSVVEIIEVARRTFRWPRRIGTNHLPCRSIHMSPPIARIVRQDRAVARWPRRARRAPEEPPQPHEARLPKDAPAATPGAKARRARRRSTVPARAKRVRRSPCRR
jgi:hypothetical protein